MPWRARDLLPSIAMDAATVVFLGCVGTVAYVLAGYPLWLGLLASLRSRPVRRAEELKTVSVILPVHNGERWIERKLRSIKALDYPEELLEIVVVSDGSTDATCEIVASFEGVRLLCVPRGGKARAINRALEAAGGEIVLFTDVRQELEPGSLRRLVSCFADPAVGVASGELLIRSGGAFEQDGIGLYWSYEKWIRRQQSRLDSVMGATGALYAVRRELARPLPPDTLLDDVHLPMQIFLQGYRVVFVEHAHAYDDAAALHTEFRRKVRTLAGVYQLLARIPALLGPRNRMWFHFVSHKVGRLLLPFALLGALASSFFLPPPWSAALVGAQTLGLALAALDRFVPDRFPLKRLSSLAQTFVVLMAATLCAAAIVFRPPESFWESPTA